MIQNGRIQTPRLAFAGFGEKRPVTYEVVARFIDEYCPSNMLFYLDTCFLTGDELPMVLWNALLRKEVVIAPLVWGELRDWLNAPHYNKSIRDALLTARWQGHPSIRFLHYEDWPKHLVQAHSYYVNLLLVRKRLARALEESFIEEHGRPPTSDELSRLVHRNSTDESRQLIQKGRERIDSWKFFTDEQLVVTAVFDSLMQGREMTLLGRDRDMIEQFYKLLSLVDIHYLAMLFAERFKNGPFGIAFPLVRQTPELRHYFANDYGLLVKKPVTDLAEFVPRLLPADHQPNALYCMLFGNKAPAMIYSTITYHAERDMLRLLITKGLTGGRNTHVLGRNNCHVSGFPRTVKELCAVQRRRFPVSRISPGDGSLQPEAIGAAEEVTNPSKPLMKRVT